MRKGNTIKIILLICMLAFGTTGCGKSFIEYCIREDPEKAMERYLEEKYDDEFTLVSWEAEDSFQFFWDKTGFSGKFKSEKYPDKEIRVGARVLKEGLGYKFWDDYIQLVYVDVLDDIMKSTAEKYFSGEYYVYTYVYGALEDDTTPVMSFEEYVADDYHFGVCIFAEEMDDESALKAMEMFRKDIMMQNILCNFYLGKINQEDISKEDFLRDMEKEGEAFNPWMTFGSEHYTNWLYEECEGEYSDFFD